MVGSAEIGVEMCTELGPGAGIAFVTGTWAVAGTGVGLGLGTNAGDNRLAETEV